MSIGDVGRVPIQQPVDLSQAQQSDFEQIADNLIEAGSPLSKDEIVSNLQYVQQNNTELTQGMVDKLQAGEPILTRPTDVTVDFANLAKDVEENPFLRANPMAVFCIVFLELAFSLSKSKLQEGLIGAETIVQMAEMAKDIAAQIIDIAHTKATALIVSGCMSIASGVVNIGGGVAGMRGWGVTKTGTSMGTTMLGSGIGKLFEGTGEIVKGFMAIKEGEQEAVKTLMENMMKTLERRMQAANDEYKSNNELLTQVLQTMQKVIEEELKAHSLQRG